MNVKQTFIVSVYMYLKPGLVARSDAHRPGMQTVASLINRFSRL